MPLGSRDEKRVTSGVDFLPTFCTLTFEEHKVGLDEKSNVERRFKGFEPNPHQLHFLKKIFFPERTEVRTEGTEPNTLSAL